MIKDKRRSRQSVAGPSTSDVDKCVEHTTALKTSRETTVPSTRTVEIHFDPLVMHTIALLQYERRLEYYRVKRGPPPPLPALSPEKVNLANSEDMANEFSEESIELLLRKAVAVLAAHLGFVKMESSMIYLLSRIVASRIQRMCENLKLSHRRRVEGRETAFPSALMHALYLEDIRHVTELQQFYRNRVVLYRDRVLLSCTQKFEKVAKKVGGRQIKKTNSIADEDSRNSGTKEAYPDNSTPSSKTL